MKLLRLLSYFLTGATATTLGGWALSFTPSFILIGVYAVVFCLLFLFLSIVFDDPIASFLNLETQEYYLGIGAIVFCLVSGLAVLGGLLWK